MSARRRVAGCGFLMPWLEECGSATDWAVSTRHSPQSEWVSHPVCSGHVDALREELASIGLFDRVSEAYDVHDVDARGRLERIAARSAPYRPGETWRWMLCSFGGGAHEVSEIEVLGTYETGFLVAGVCVVCGTPCVNRSELGGTVFAQPWWPA